MAEVQLEHVNITVRDARQTAQLLTRLFGWQVRWQGEAKDEGFSVHVGGEQSYLALYQRDGGQLPERASYDQINGLNHLAVTVDDLDAAEARVRAEGLAPHSHADYAPGRRFYFDLPDALEVEVVSY